jgi:L-ascorbate metabolism protein UlaG (beta-lactamase superfamily)
MDIPKIMKEYWQSSSQERAPQKPIPVNMLSAKDFSDIPSETLKVNWFGHSTVIMEMEGMRMAIDPVFSMRVSPFGFMGPKRHHPAPMAPADLPRLDLVLISHNHYDHLDYETIKALVGRDITYFAPLGVGATLQHWGIPTKNIHEFDWHDSLEFKGITFTATPARHFTSRGLTDRNKTLWCGFAIHSAQQRVFYCGDSGQFPGFADIGSQYGPFDLSLMPIGAYNDLWHDIHLNPEEAVEAHLGIQAKRMLPLHWCTFDLALHTWAEPIERLLVDAEQHDVDLILPGIGEWVTVEEYQRNGEWWR